MSKAVVVKQTPKVNLDRKRQTFSKEFKREAVRLLERGYSPGTKLRFVVRKLKFID
jgi:transposase-like protein